MTLLCAERHLWSSYKWLEMLELRRFFLFQHLLQSFFLLLISLCFIFVYFLIISIFVFIHYAFIFLLLSNSSHPPSPSPSYSLFLPPLTFHLNLFLFGSLMQVFFASAAPPVRYSNVYGIDIPTRNELIAHGRTEEEIGTYIRAYMI